jgi:hypothetical protein
VQYRVLLRNIDGSVVVFLPFGVGVGVWRIARDEPRFDKGKKDIPHDR